MAFANSTVLKTPTVLEQLLEEINFQRTKEMRQLLKDGNLKKYIYILNFIYLLLYFCRLRVCNASRHNILDRPFCQTFPLPK